MFLQKEANIAKMPKVNKNIVVLLFCFTFSICGGIIRIVGL